MSTKLIIKFPLPLVELRKEIDFPSASVIQFFSRIFAQNSKLPDPIAWGAIIQFALQFVLDDMYTEGRIQGGWGKSYVHKYLSLNYPNGIPGDASRQPDSPSCTCMVIQGLYDLLETKQFLDGKSRDAISACLKASAKYLEDRYNLKTGELGLMNILLAGDYSLSYNPRHTAMGIKAWRRLPSQYSRLVGACTNIIESADEMDLDSQRTLTVATILSALLCIESDKPLKRGIPKAHRIPYLRQKAIAALLHQWSNAYDGWIEPENPETSANWHTAFVIRECEAASGDFGNDLRERLKAAQNALLTRMVTADIGGAGLPYAKGRLPDLGMTCMLFEMLARSGAHKTENQDFQNICKFITATGSGRNEARFTIETYPWTLVSLFSGLKVLASEGN